MSLIAPTHALDESRRKRNIEEVADAENPPDALRLRVSPEGHGQEEYQYSSDSDSDGSSVEEESFDKGDTRDSSYENGGAETLARDKSATEQPQHPDSRAVPQSWEQTSQADRILFTMRTQGSSWDEIAKAWSEETGHVTTHTVLSDRYKLLEDHMQSLKQGDRDRLLAAVVSVKAAFRREKWSLIKFAMARAGSADYSEAFIHNQYKRLGRTSHNSTKNNQRGERADEFKAGASVEESQKFKPAPRSLEATKLSNVPSLRKDKKLESQEIKKETQKHDAAFLPKAEDRIYVNGRSSVKPGTLPHNAIVLDDPVPVPSPRINSNGYGAPTSPTMAESSVPGPRSAAVLPGTISRSGPPPSTTASRIGSVTNRGPARFTSIHKVVDKKETSKEKGILKHLPSASELKTGDTPADSLPRGFGILSNQKHTPHELSSSIKQRLEQQEDSLSQNDAVQTHSTPPQAMYMPSGSRSASAQLTGTQQLPVSQRAVSHEVPKQIAVNKPLAYQRPTVDSTPLQNDNPQQPPIQSIEIESQSKALTTGTSVATQPTDGRPMKSVSTTQLKYMLRHRTLSNANRNKTWDVIARECGVTATLAEISAALEHAGYPSILNTSEPMPPAASTAPSPLPQLASNGASHPPAFRSRTPPAYKAFFPPAAVPPQRPPDHGTFVAPEVPTVPAREIETPAPTTTPSLDGTPSTRSKRGRPPGSRNRAKDEMRQENSISPSQTNTTSSSRKRSAASKAAQSAAMRAAWARRKARAAANGVNNGSPNPSTATTQNSPVENSVASFAAKILATAAAKKTSPAPTPAAKGQSFEDEPVDLLTGESMFAQHSVATPPVNTGNPPARKKVVRRNISSGYASTVQNQPVTQEPEKIVAEEEISTESIVRSPNFLL